MRDLTSTLRFCFEHWSGEYRAFSKSRASENYAQMATHLTSDIFEIPVCMLDVFYNKSKLMRMSSFDTVVMELVNIGRYSSVKSPSSALKNVLTARNNRDIKLVQFPYENQSIPPYYSTFGAVFDKDFKPVFIMSWQMKRFPDSEGLYKYIFIRPIFRVSPKVILQKDDAVKRYIVNKVIPAILTMGPVSVPAVNSLIGNSNELFKVKVEIDDFPFVIKSADAPSISTTNKMLIDLAIDNIDEIVQ